ncbi:MAG: hypothetical protein NZL89_04990 [Leptospiraceae bacterium]|nr:hypothetical protein [Leptospiraceae bacterium]
MVFHYTVLFTKIALAFYAELYRLEEKARNSEEIRELMPFHLPL